ncbi:toll/interleukin-1 receptor domain-containing protein [Bacillus sp. AF53]|uniref:toll/interleukin-1 receptor domain-containing protein n=1 Tax=Bacillus sp. AF53 TaxID=3158958 RepID=UPI00398FC935
MNTNDFFISHATADHELVSEIVDFMEVALKVDREKIYCTSGEGTKKIRTGTNFISDIKDNVCGTKLVIFILTPNYFKSNFCLAELGAAWAFNSDVYPIVIPPTPRGLLKSTPLSETTQALTLNTYEDLIDMADEFKRLGIAEYSSAKVLNTRAQKLIRWIEENYSFDIEDTVSKSEYLAVQDQLEGLKSEFQAKQLEIAHLTAYYEKTLKTEREANAKSKNGAYVIQGAVRNVGTIQRLRITDTVKEEEEVAEETTDKWGIFEERVKKVRDTISRLDDIVLSAIYYDTFNQGIRFWPDQDGFFNWGKVHALELENMIRVDSDEQRITPNYDEFLVRKAIDSLDDLLRYILNDIDETMVEEFADDNEFYLDFSSKKFWEKILNVRIFV